MWLTLALAASLGTPPAPPPQIDVARLPSGFVQPAVAAWPGGGLRVVCLKGDPKGADVVLLRRGPGQAGFDPPEPVNFIPGAAVALGTIRGPRVAVGAKGRLHVLWNGSKSAGDSLVSDAPLVYTRSDPATGAFDRERDLVGETTALDGGAAIAADGKGAVVVAWHGTGPGLPKDETHRTVYVRRSTDDGETWGPAIRVLDEPGVCACCSIAMGLAPDGRPRVLYRGARTLTDRDMKLVTLAAPPASPRHPVRVEDLDLWQTRSCPMTSCDFVRSPAALFAAWEDNGQVHAAEVRADGTIWERRTPGGEAGARKHPRVCLNDRGEMLLVWTEGTGWEKGGSVAWQLFAPTGQAVQDGAGRGPDLPAWDFAVPVALPGERFEVLY
jgi:hypothetical protein